MYKKLFCLSRCLHTLHVEHARSLIWVCCRLWCSLPQLKVQVFVFLHISSTTPPLSLSRRTTLTLTYTFLCSLPVHPPKDAASKFAANKQKMKLLLLFLLLCVAAKSSNSPWRVIQGYDLTEPHSLYFDTALYGNFSCPAVKCTKQELKTGFGYFMAATSHANTFELLVFRVCRYLQTCIRHNHMFITFRCVLNTSRRPCTFIYI